MGLAANLKRLFGNLIVLEENKVEIPIQFNCYKCKKTNTTTVEIKESVKKSNGSVTVALNCEFCTSLYHGSELATTNMLDLDFKKYNL